MLVHIDHITSAHFRPGQGDVKTRLGLDLDERLNDIVLFGDGCRADVAGVARAER